MEKSLKLIVFFTILLSPLYVIRWQYFGVLPTTLLEALIWGVMVLWAVWRIQARDFSWTKTPFFKPTLLLLLAGVLSLFITPDLRGGLGIFRAYFFEPVLFFYVLVDLFEKGVMRTTKVIEGLVLAGFGLSVLGVVQVFTHQLIFAPQEIGRAHGVFNSGNALALFLGPILILLLGELRTLAGWKKKIAEGVGGTMLVAFILTKSQGGWMALALTLILWRFAENLGRIWFQRVLKAVFSLSLVACLLLLISVSYFTPKNVVNPWQRLSSSTLRVRFCLWEGTRNLLADRPIFGAGLSGFKELYSQKYFTCDAEPLEYPHNLFLTFWTELGILGLLGFLGLIYLFLFRFSPSALHFSILYLLIHGLVDVPYFKNDLSLEFWVFMGLALMVDSDFRLKFAPLTQE